MTRRFKPSMISTSHEDTRRADMLREWSQPEPAPFERPEPEPEPERQPKPGRPRNLTPPPLNDTSPVLRTFDQAMQTTTDPAVKRRLRAAQREMAAQIKRDVPPGVHPNVYGY